MNRSELFTRGITGFFIVAITLGAILYSPWTYLLWLCLIVFLATHEYLQLEKMPHALPWIWIFPFILTVIVAGTGYSFIHKVETFLVFAILPLVIGAMFLVWLITQKETGGLVISLKAAYSATTYIGLPAISGCFFLSGDYSYKLILVPVILIWLNDVGAYLIGSQWGKHKIAPAISPGKSMEGTIGGGLVTLLAGFLLSQWWSEIPFNYMLGLSLAVPFFALGGDLWESALKRKAGVKDSGHILPGHGGILDRYDSLLFVMPVAALAYYIFVV